MTYDKKINFIAGVKKVPLGWVARYGFDTPAGRIEYLGNVVRTNIENARKDAHKENYFLQELNEGRKPAPFNDIAS